MKSMKNSLSALLVIAAVVTVAASDKVTVASTSDVAVTNIAPLLWVGVSTIPSSYFVNPSNVSPASIIIVDTDGSGKNLQLKGQLAALAYLTPSDTITTISAVTEKGKIQGQAVNGQGYFGRFNP